MSARTLVLPLCAVLAACGGGDDSAPPAATQVAQAPLATATPTPTATVGAPTQTAPAEATASAEPPAATPVDTERAAATPTPNKEAIARQTPAPTATPLPKDAPTATPTPKPKPKPKRLNGPLTCLTEAKLYKPHESGAKLWSASIGKSEKLVAVDGPYKSPRDAQISVESLGSLSDAEVGGNYVVSAQRTSEAKAVVSKVADCLDERDT